jgi:hypothetical protein
MNPPMKPIHGKIFITSVMAKKIYKMTNANKENHRGLTIEFIDENPLDQSKYIYTYSIIDENNLSGEEII